MSNKSTQIQTDLKNPTLIQTIICFFVEVGAIVPLVGMAKLGIVLYLFQFNPTLIPFIAIGLVTLPVYFGDRLFVDSEDKNNEKKALRNQLLQKFHTPLSVSVLLSFLLFQGIIFFFLSIPQALLLQFPFFVFVLYPKLKKYNYLDTLSIAMAWSIELIGIALFFGNRTPTNLTLSIAFIAMFCMKIAETEIGNIRDVEGDLKAGNNTFPSIYGVEKTTYLILSLLIFSFGCIILLSHSLIIQGLTLLTVSLLLLSERTVTPDSARDIMFIDRSLKITLASCMIIFVLWF
jgi:4-hydroxybenzoate polyprenyltransferase